MNVICLTDINECQSSPCFHGDCTDHVNSYSCHCYPGYTGTQCQIGKSICVHSKIALIHNRHFEQNFTSDLSFQIVMNALVLHAYSETVRTKSIDMFVTVYLAILDSFVT